MRQIGIDPRVDRVVVAGAEMGVGLEPVLFAAAHHQRDLGVGLELDEAEHHLGAGAFEVARPADVALLVEPRLELDQRGHRLAPLGGLAQSRHGRRILAGAVERLLDRHHVRVLRRLAQEAHHHVEALIGVVDDDVLLPDRREAVAVMVGDALGEARRVGLELEVRPVAQDKPRGLG